MSPCILTQRSNIPCPGRNRRRKGPSQWTGSCWSYKILMLWWFLLAGTMIPTYLNHAWIGSSIFRCHLKKCWALNPATVETVTVFQWIWAEHQVDMIPVILLEVCWSNLISLVLQPIARSLVMLCHSFWRGFVQVSPLDVRSAPFQSVSCIACPATGISVSGDFTGQSPTYLVLHFILKDWQSQIGPWRPCFLSPPERPQVKEDDGVASRLKHWCASVQL